jgi:hypothetical protein
LDFCGFVTTLEIYLLFILRIHHCLQSHVNAGGVNSRFTELAEAGSAGWQCIWHFFAQKLSAPQTERPERARQRPALQAGIAQSDSL